MKLSLMRLRSDTGSQSILGIGAAIFVLALTLVTASATQLFRQQEQVQVTADALALDLADLLRFNAEQRLKDPTIPNVDIASEAPAELVSLSATQGSQLRRAPRIARAQQNGLDEVAVQVCEVSALSQLPIIKGFAGQSEICARARSRTVLPE
jgi:hypothetical protein